MVDTGSSLPEPSNILPGSFTTSETTAPLSENFPPHARPTPEPETAGLKLSIMPGMRCSVVDSYLSVMPAHKASDFYLNPGPGESGFRINGQVICFDGKREGFQMADWNELSIRDAISGLLREEQRRFFDQNHHINFSVSLGDLRFRGHARETVSGIQAVFRHIPSTPPTIEALAMLEPQKEILKKLAATRNGIILISGATGSGKSTTIAALMTEILKANKSVISLEAPIEFNLGACPGREGIVSQSEVGLHVPSFAQGIKNAMRSAPDVIMVGEILDIEEADAALQAAETGHLVVATIHARGAVSAVDRLLGMYNGQKGEARARAQLSQTLEAVIYQNLIPRLDGRSRVAACEILIGTPGACSQIRKNEHHLLENTIQTGKNFGMWGFDDALSLLVAKGEISVQEAVSRARDEGMLKQRLNTGRSLHAV